LTFAIDIELPNDVCERRFANKGDRHARVGHERGHVAFLMPRVRISLPFVLRFARYSAPPWSHIAHFSDRCVYRHVHARTFTCAYTYMCIYVHIRTYMWVGDSI